MGNGNQQWVYIVVGVVGLLCIGFAVRQCGSSSSPDALQREADRAVELAANGDSDGWTVREEGDAASAAGESGAGGGRRSKGSASGGDPASDSGSGSAETVRNELRRRSQQAAAAAVGGPGVRVDAAAPGGLNAGSGSPFKDARERAAKLGGGSQPLVAAAPAVLDAEGNDPSETPALSVLAKEGEARDDQQLVDGNSATYKAGEGHVFDTESQVTIPNAGNITGDAGSIAFELKPKWEGGDNSDATLLDLRTPDKWENRMEVVKNGPYLRFLMWDSQGNENGIGYEIKNWQPDSVHPMAMTWGADENGVKQMQLYVDGALVGRHAYEHDFDVPNDQPLVIGNNSKGDRGARSVLNGFQVYNKPLTSDRIGGLSFSSGH